MAYFDKQKMSDGTVVDVHDTEGRAIADANLSAAKIELNNTITTKVNKETTARENADSALQDADTALQNAITAEQLARENADTALQNAIGQNQSTLFAKLVSGAKCYFIGDSISEGYGWWGGNVENKNNNNDGFAPAFREKFPKSTFTNLSAGGSTIASGMATSPTIKTQAAATSDADLIFVCAGVNDFTLAYNQTVGPERLGSLPNMLQDSSWYNDSNTYNAIGATFQTLKQNNPNAVIVWITTNTAPVNDYGPYYAHFDNIKRVCQFLGVAVFDCYCHIPRYESPGAAQYYYDRLHYGQKGYALLSESLISFVGNIVPEWQLVTNILLCRNGSTSGNAVKTMFAIYPLWWIDGSYKIQPVIPTYYANIQITFTKEGNQASGIFSYNKASNLQSFSFYFVENTNTLLSCAILTYYYNPPIEKLTDLAPYMPGVFIIPANRAASITDLPTELKTADLGDIIVKTDSGGYSMNGIIHSTYSTGNSILPAFFFSRKDDNSFYYWKITNTLQS